MLKSLFVSAVRLDILKIMLPHPTTPMHIRGLVRSVGTEINAVRRELTNLEEAGILRKRRSSNKIYYSVNLDNVYYPELLSLICKETGLGSEIIKNQKKLGEIKYAILSRAFSRGRESSSLDIDLFLVGDVKINVLDEIISKLEEVEKKEVNYTIMKEEEFLFRKRKNDHFVARILAQSRTILIGNEEEFCKI